MKNKKSLLLIPLVALASLGFLFAVASAQVPTTKAEKVAEIAKNENSGGKKVQDNISESAAKTATTEGQPQEKAKKDVKKSKGVANGEEHRSAVATFVQSLLAVADREGGIGQEVRVIAQQQNDAKDRTGDLINAVEARNKVKTFFIGTSYKNLGELRSQMVKTKNQIEQLKKLSEKAENDQDKIELQAQISTLEEQQAKIDNFIVGNESKFSLFGWAVKLFRK